MSKDGDWRAFCQNSQRLYLVSDIERALALVNDAPLGLMRAIQSWLGAGGEGQAEIQPLLERSVEQIEFTVNGQATHGELEMLAWGGGLKTVIWPDEADIDIIEIETAEDNTSIRVVVSLPLFFSVKVSVELNFSVWDSVDKESLEMGGRTIEVEDEFDVRATITLNVYGQGTDNEELELVESELDIQYREIELGEVDMFEPEDYWDASE